MGNTLSYNQEPVVVSFGERGKIRGIQFDNKSRRFAGVPYALPPTGNRRWRKPCVLPPSHTYSDGDGSPYDATRFKSVCPQKAFHIGDAEGGAAKYSEDCLFVNIWTPVPKSETDKGLWPVMLWLHGGWFQMGDPSQEPGMDPTEMISTGGLNSIVVSIGYRLNVFGFLAGVDLLTDSEGESAGNFGLWDQRAAIEWVTNNIHYFGGDPNNVTLAGRSAGAYSVEAQLLYEFQQPPSTSSTFRRVFMDSNAIPAQPKSLDDAQNQLDELCGHFGINSQLTAVEKVNALRLLSPQDLTQAIPRLRHHTFRPVTDELFIKPSMIEYLESKEFANQFKKRGFRLLIGEVRNEETLYSSYNPPLEPNLEALKLQVSNYYAPDVTDRVIQRYPLPQTGQLEDWQKLFGRIIADGQVCAPSRALAKSLTENGVSIEDIWRYHIAYRLSFIDEKVAPMSYGVAHATDKPFWNFSICHGPTDRERRLMEDWIRILVAFVRDDRAYNFGTQRVEEVKVMNPDTSITVQVDERWDDLIETGKIFSNGLTKS
ncbi:Alpha/Beta hydrolase protein [Stachybotrys elegans]|uniref:Carboxylic ester hydrolase n=1 Tax=Stachybotrys elegans TaxID=80388 RepID=A0A8K0WPM7_9HYPO|nr:Alpha/Beta hydrolase protein [Stachybotrys elegans]